MASVGECNFFIIFGGNLDRVENYSNVLHKVMYKDGKVRSVTTHCNYGFYDSKLNIIAKDENGLVMCVEDANKKKYLDSCGTLREM